MNYTDEQGDVRVGKIITHVILGLLIGGLIFGSFGTVGAGYKGVKTRFGNVVGSVNPGLYFKLPFIEHIVKLNIQTQKEETDSTAASKDLQDVKATVALNYNIDPAYVGELYANIGSEYKIRIIDPAIQEAVKAATAQYTAEELVTKRPLVRDSIKEALTGRLQTEYIIVSEVSIVNFSFSKSFNDAIEAKVTAEQNALAAKNKLEQVKYEADQRISEAKGEAEAIRIQAQAIQQQGGAEYVNLKSVEKWDGKLPTYMMGNSVPFINLSK